MLGSQGVAPPPDILPLLQRVAPLGLQRVDAGLTGSCPSSRHFAPPPESCPSGVAESRSWGHRELPLLQTFCPSSRELPLWGCRELQLGSQGVAPPPAVLTTDIVVSPC